VDDYVFYLARKIVATGTREVTLEFYNDALP
jgi:hypothetical protein